MEGKVAEKNVGCTSKRRGGIYVHVPYCRRKCLYCDFYSVGERCADWGRFVDACLSEMAARREEWCEWDEITLYIGGGTPSLIPASEFRRLAEGIRRQLAEGHDTPPEILEFTVEVNPDDVDEEKARAWREAGVDRISMGVQSLVDSELKAIGRRHTAERALEAYGLLRPLFGNISLDLIFGLPGQTLDSLLESVRGVAALRPEHVSIYSLTYEENSALTRMRDAGRVQEVPEGLYEDMYRGIKREMDAAGYEMYEISNYALPGRRSRHNSSYWQGLPYVGLGPSAHSYDGADRRRWNVADVNRYIAGKGSTSGPEHEVEMLSAEERREEMLLTRLRTAEGLDLGRYGEAFGAEELARLRSRAARCDRRLVEIPADNRLRLTFDGVMVSDEVISMFF